MDPRLLITVLAVAAGAAALLWAFDRVLLALEDRGHLFYRRSRLSARSFGGALLAPFSLVDPDKRHVVEERQAEDLRRQEDVCGGPDEAGRGEPPAASPPRAPRHPAGRGSRRSLAASSAPRRSRAVASSPGWPGRKRSSR